MMMTYRTTVMNCQSSLFSCIEIEPNQFTLLNKKYRKIQGWFTNPQIKQARTASSPGLR